MLRTSQSAPRAGSRLPLRDGRRLDVARVVVYGGETLVTAAPAADVR